MTFRLLPLMIILVIAWILIFVGSIIIFYLIVPIPDIFPGRFGALITAGLKALLAAILVGLWLMIMVKLRDIYVKRKLLA